MFCVERRRHWLTSKSSFSRQCVGRICDTCSQLTWKSHSPRTRGGTFWPTLTPAQTLYLCESCQNKPKCEVCKMAKLPFDICVASSSVVFMINAASWHETYVTHTYTHSLTAILAGKRESASFPLTFPLHTSPLTPSHHVLLRQEKGRQWRKRSGGKVHSMRGNWCRILVAGCPSCHQLVLKSSTGPHPFFNQQQTPEARDVAPFYVCFQTLITFLFFPSLRPSHTSTEASFMCIDISTQLTYKNTDLINTKTNVRTTALRQQKDQKRFF